MSILILGLAACLIVIFFQDLKFRHIHIALPLIILAISLYNFYENLNFESKIYIWNSIFFIIVLSTLIIYMSIKHRKIINPFSHYFGLGDLMFFLAVTPLFLPYNYILFFILSMLFSLALQQVFKKYMVQNTVPLAGFSALLLLLLIVKDVLLEFNKITLL